LGQGDGAVRPGSLQVNRSDTGQFPEVLVAGPGDALGWPSHLFKL